jgi:DNA-directed RNA polymerase specialized sigma24 family protein
VIGKTLALEAPGRVRSLERGARQELLVDDALLRGTARFADERMVPLAELRLPSEPSWEPHDALAEIMVADCGAYAIRSVRSRLNSAGMALGYAELHDLATAFVNAHLRAAIRSFDPVRGEGKEGAWLGTVLYRFALRHALMARRIESSFDLAFEVPDPSPSPEKQLENEARERALKMLPAVLERLPETQRRAIALYFGLAGREHTIREVAEALDTNPYFARLAITSGVVSLAAGLGAEGLLSQHDLRLAKALFVEGEDLNAAALRLGMSRSDMKRQMARVADSVRSSLRPRTVLPNTTSRSGAPDMTKASDLLATEISRDLIAHRLTIERRGKSAFVIVGGKLGKPVALDRARKLMRSRIDELVAAGVEIDEEAARLFAPEGPRTDLSDEDAAWVALLQAAAQASLFGVEALLQTWKTEAQKANLEIKLSDTELAERIRDSLATVTSALEQSMPRAARRSGTARLWIRFGESPEDATFGWVDEARQGEPPRLLSLVRHRLGLVGDFDGPALDLLGRCAVRGLQEGWGVLPRFTWEAPRQRAEVLLTWTKPYL